MTVEKVKKMQGNLTLVVSWNVGENQEMPPREVKFKLDACQRIVIS